MRGRYPITAGGLRKVKDELIHLRKVERPKNLDDIARAADHGDLKENAEYHAAKERRMFINAQMVRLEDIVSRAQVIEPASLSLDRVVFGATVTVFDVDTEEELTYTILSPIEADPREGCISHESPLARALIGKEEGDEIVIPGGDGRTGRTLEVVSLEFTWSKDEV